MRGEGGVGVESTGSAVGPLLGPYRSHRYLLLRVDVASRASTKVASVGTNLRHRGSVPPASPAGVVSHPT